MNTNAPPSKNPANVDALAGALDLILTKFLQNVDNMLPVNVIKYDRVHNLAQVQPLIQMVTTLDEAVNRAEIAAVPVLQLGGGGFVMSFPLQTNDLGWIHANDRDISLFKQSLNNSPPNTNRKWSFSDGLLIPDTMFQEVVIAAEDSGNAVLQNLGGTVKLALWTNQMKILSPNTVITDQPSYTAAAGAVLDVQSISKAFKIPRMTTAQRNSIASPIGGMMVYLTDVPKYSNYTDGVGWS